MYVVHAPMVQLGTESRNFSGEEKTRQEQDALNSDGSRCRAADKTVVCVSDAVMLRNHRADTASMEIHACLGTSNSNT